MDAVKDGVDDFEGMQTYNKCNEALNSILILLQDNIWNLTYKFKNKYDKYMYDNIEKIN